MKKRRIDLSFLHFRRNARVLDVGCGAGIDLEYLISEYSIEGYGVDIACAFRERKINFHFLICDAANLPFRDRSFDIVYSLGVIEHLPRSENAIEESFRVLRKDGQVLHTVPNFLSLHTLFDRPIRKIFRKCLWDLNDRTRFPIFLPPLGDQDLIK